MARMSKGADSAITAEEHARWLKPDDALTRLPTDWGRGHAVNALTTHLRMGGIRAVARRGLIATESGQETVDLYLLDPALWDENQWVQGPGALWVTGQVSFRRGSRLAEVLRQPPEQWIEHTFTGVRFDPIQFNAAFDLEAASESENANQDVTSQERKPIAPAEMKRFAQLYLEIWGEQAREGKALEAIRACYPEAGIGRDPFYTNFRELRGPGRRGKPPIRG